MWISLNIKSAKKKLLLKIHNDIMSSLGKGEVLMLCCTWSLSYIWYHWSQYSSRRAQQKYGIEWTALLYLNIKTHIQQFMHLWQTRNCLINCKSHKTQLYDLWKYDRIPHVRKELYWLPVHVRFRFQILNMTWHSLALHDESP